MEAFSRAVLLKFTCPKGAVDALYPPSTKPALLIGHTVTFEG
jgi:hypothetical protein